ncbi:MAG: enoyl-CoA hydratase/isomerase family protein [Xanthobacteraceae bacterium]|nr:enoyl-CoA hydratase/isomerase family protein [Xanthobacteraceae bacterium]
MSSRAQAAASGDGAAVLARAGIAPEAAAAFLESPPRINGDFAADCAAFSPYWTQAAALRAGLPPKRARNADQAAACALILDAAREAREDFLARHVENLYRKLTGSFTRFVRAEDLVYEAARAVPGLAPTAAEVEEEAKHPLKGKDGLEIDQGILLSHIFAHGACGRHLCHAMLLPRPGSRERLAELGSRGALDFGAAAVSRLGRASLVEMKHPRFLNALDDTTLDAIEAAVDVAILDSTTAIAVLRGGCVDHSRHARVFSSGINLTRLYRGEISYLFYIKHILGFENKILRGVAQPHRPPDEAIGATAEKPWIAAVDGFAIGGGCQHLLVMDYVLAASDAYLTLPARKEGIIPGAANMRLPGFTGDRIARQAIMYGRRLDCDSPEGRLICDEVVPPHDMDAALMRVIDAMTSSGVVSAVANRRGFRVVQEPLETFLAYLAVYAREQAYCHFSPALIDNLERYWDARNRNP